MQIPPRKVLVIDDDPDGIALVEVMLKARGFDVMSAASGPEGLNALRDTLPDLILLDINMPDMNGHQVGLLLQNDFPDIPVMMLTSSTKQQDQYKATMTGTVRYISKSEELQDIGTIISDYFNRHKKSSRP